MKFKIFMEKINSKFKVLVSSWEGYLGKDLKVQRDSIVTIIFYFFSEVVSVGDSVYYSWCFFVCLSYFS